MTYQDEIITQCGGVYKGTLDSMVYFNHPHTNSTLAIHLRDLSRDNVTAKLNAHLRDWLEQEENASRDPKA